MCESMSKRIWGRSENISVSIELSKFKWSSTLLAITQVALRAAGTSWIRPLYFALNCELDPLEKASFFPMLCNYYELKIEDSTYYKGISLNTMFSCVNTILKIKMQDHSLK